MKLNKKLDLNSFTKKLGKLKTIDTVDANAAVVVLLRSHNKKLEILFVKRAQRSNDPWSGQIALPGGKRNPEDNDLKETIIRETFEEIGVNLIENCRFLGIMDPLRSIQRPAIKIVPFIFLQEKKQKIVLNEELTGYFWAKLIELAKNKTVFKFRLKDYPAYIIKGQVVWGLTHKIVDNLLSILQI